MTSFPPKENNNSTSATTNSERKLYEKEGEVSHMTQVQKDNSITDYENIEINTEDDSSALLEEQTSKESYISNNGQLVDVVMDNYLNKRRLYIIILMLAFSNAVDAIEVLAIGFILPVYTDSDHPSGLSSDEKGLLTASIYMGMLIGALVGGRLSDSLSRKGTLICSILLSGTMGLLSAFAPSFNWLFVMRTITGVGVGCSVPCLFTWGAELFPTQKRGIYLSYVASFWMVGQIYISIAAWIILGNDKNNNKILPNTWGWRQFLIISAIPMLIISLSLNYLVPSSPRWLIKKGKYKEAALALNFLTGYSATFSGSRQIESSRPTSSSLDNMPSLNIQFNPNTGEEEIDILSSSSTSDASTQDSRDSSAKQTLNTCNQRTSAMNKKMNQIDHRKAPSIQKKVENGIRYEDLLSIYSTKVENVGDKVKKNSISESIKKTFHGVFAVFEKDLRFSTIYLIIIWFTLCFGSYGISTWISSIFFSMGMSNPYFPTLLFAIANLPGNIASFFLIEKIGRKKLIGYSMLLASFSGNLYILTYKKYPWIAVICTCAFNAFSVSGWNSLDALSTEIYPTEIRTTGMAVLSSTGRFASIIAQIVNGELEDNTKLVFSVTSILMIIGSTVAFFLPHEPKGKILA